MIVLALCSKTFEPWSSRTFRPVSLTITSTNKKQQLLTLINRDLINIDQTTLSASKFWDFSLEYYKSEGSEQLLLRLQDKYGLDVNILLLALWAGNSLGSILDQTHFESLDNAIEDWRTNIIQPLRQVRQHTKQLGGLDPTIRSSLVKMMEKIELRSEHACQTILINQFSSLNGVEQTRDTHIAATNNLDSYLTYSNVANTEEICSIRQKLLMLMKKFFCKP